MDSQASELTLGLLPEARTRWGRFVLGYGMQSAVMAFFVISAIAYPEVLVLPVHDYHFVGLVSIPSPVPQAPAPVRHFRVPEPKITEPVTPRPEALRVPAELVRKKNAPARRASAQGDTGVEQRASAGREADDPAATGQDQCVLHG